MWSFNKLCRLWPQFKNVPDLSSTGESLHPHIHMIMSQLPFYFLIFFWLIDYPLITISYSCTNLVDNNQNCQQRSPNNVIRYFVCDIFGIAYGSVSHGLKGPITLGIQQFQSLKLIQLGIKIDGNQLELERKLLSHKSTQNYFFLFMQNY
jgi:hypothetical protein